MTTSSWLQLANKTAVVTGAASGIGKAVAKALVGEQCHVILVDQNTSQLEQVAQECSQIQIHSSAMNNTNITTFSCNVANENQVQELFQQQQQQNDNNKPATILINCAGITRDNWITKMTLEQWQQVQDVNLTGTFLCCREFLLQPGLQKLSSVSSSSSSSSKENDNNNSQLQQQQQPLSASIVNISSVVATQGNLAQVNYAASKGGVWSMTKALAKEVASRNIRVNCVLPGFINTEMTQAVPLDIRENVIRPKIVFQQKFGHVDDIANLCLFLASCHRSGYITGQAIECSGMIAL